jgi:copper chaperone CopZ
MKSFFIVLLAFSFTPLTANAETAKITVNGMVCAFCAQGIEKSLSQFNAVDQVHVDLDQMLVTAHIKDGFALDDATIQKSINDSGLDMVKIERSTP